MDALDEFNDDSLCKVCGVRDYKYVCPKCNLPYCSVDCYRANSHLECSETFYKEWITVDMKGRDKSASMKATIDLLKKYHDDGIDSLDSDDDIEGLELAERLEGIDLDDADAVWEQLTEEEKLSFNDMVSSGKITELMPVWRPWWEQKFTKPKVKFLNDDEFGYITSCPKYLPCIIPLSSLTKHKPSSSVIFNVTNVLGAYVLGARYYNGRMKEFPIESASILVRISSNLSSNHNFNSTQEALQSIIQEATTSNSVQLVEESFRIIDSDVAYLFEGPNEEDKHFYVMAALGDLRMLFLEAKKVVNSPQTKKSEGYFSRQYSDDTKNSIKQVSADVLYRSIKKLDYFLSWATEYLPV